MTRTSQYRSCAVVSHFTLSLLLPQRQNAAIRAILRRLLPIHQNSTLQARARTLRSSQVAATKSTSLCCVGRPSCPAIEMYSGLAESYTHDKDIPSIYQPRTAHMQYNTTHEMGVLYSIRVFLLSPALSFSLAELAAQSTEKPPLVRRRSVKRQSVETDSASDSTCGRRGLTFPESCTPTLLFAAPSLAPKNYISLIQW